MEVKCELLDQEEYESVFGRTGGRTRKGHYHGSYFWNIEGFGREKWVVTALTTLSTEAYEELTEEEMVLGAVEFLNKPVGKRKKRVPYGNLELYKYRRREDGTYVLVLITDAKKNKNFWGKGKIAPPRRKRRR